MRVANPLYDVVFKYLMDDKKIAKLMISKILDEEIESLEFRPTELKQKLSGTNFTVFRIDFAATIRQPDGHKKLVLIEIQKAKFHTDIMRFRRYLGNQYHDKNNVYYDAITEKTKALPIITLYFLGHQLDHTKSPVVKVKRRYIDAATNEELNTSEEFIESLTHDSVVIQIPRLRKKRRNNLEILLSIFDQSQKTSDSSHFLDLNEADYPDEFRMVVRCLQKAAAETDVCEIMDLEDEILDELENLERTILEQSKAIEDERECAEQERQRAEHERQRAEQADQRAEEERQRAEEERQRAEQLLAKLKALGGG